MKEGSFFEFLFPILVSVCSIVLRNERVCKQADIEIWMAENIKDLETVQER